MQIRAYLFMMAAGILIPVVLFSGLALSMLEKSGRDAALGALNETANALAQRVDRELYSAEAALTVLSASPSLAAQDYKAYYDQAKVTNGGNTVWHVLLDQDGQQLLNTMAPFGQTLPRSLTTGQARDIRASGKTIVSSVRRGPMSGRLGTTVSVPVVLPDGRSYILSQTLATEHFGRLIQGIRVPPGWLVAIIRTGRRATPPPV